jgi:hypothetical protein
LITTETIYSRTDVEDIVVVDKRSEPENGGPLLPVDLNVDEVIAALTRINESYTLMAFKSIYRPSQA